MDVPGEVIHGHQRLSESRGERFPIGNAYQERAHEPRPLRHANRVEIAKLQPGLGHRLAHHRHDLPQVLSRSQLRHHSAVLPVHINLGGHDTGQNLAPVGDHRRRRLVARGFDSQNANAHRNSPSIFIVSRLRAALVLPGAPSVRSNDRAALTNPSAHRYCATSGMKIFFIENAPNL